MEDAQPPVGVTDDKIRRAVPVEVVAEDLLRLILGEQPAAQRECKELVVHGQHEL